MSGEEQQTSKLLSVLKWVFMSAFLCILACGSLFLLLSERPTYSEAEKRELATMPTFSVDALLSGRYTTDLQTYYNDTVPYKTSFKLFADQVLSYQGMAKDDIYLYIPENRPTFNPVEVPTPTIPGATTGVSASDQTDDGTDVPDASTPTQVPALPNVNEMYQNQGILTYKGRAMELYWGSKDSMAVYAAALNQAAKRLPKVQIWSMSVPLSSAYYMPEPYASRYGNQQTDIQYISELLSKDVQVVDVYGTLARHTDESIYLKTDHHWSYLGAYYATQQMMQQAGVSLPNLNQQYTTKSVDGNLGSFYRYFGRTELAQWPETFTWYEPKFTFDATYYRYGTMDVVSTSHNKMFFFWDEPFYDMVNHGDSYLTHIVTSQKNGRRIVVFKDSFGNALAPFLAAGFEEIYVIDLRYYTGDPYTFIAEKQITDVLMASCMFTNAGSQVHYYQDLFIR